MTIPEAIAIMPGLMDNMASSPAKMCAQGANNAVYPKPKKRCPAKIKSTGNYFLKRNPEKYHAIVQMLGEGFAPFRVKRTLHVSQRTVEAIARREAKAISEIQQAYLRKARKLAQNLVEKIQARLPKMDTQELLLAFSALTDHICELEDELPVLESKRPDNPTFDNFAELIASLPRSEAQAPERAESLSGL
jgi:hypothetical protein